MKKNSGGNNMMFLGLLGALAVGGVMVWKRQQGGDEMPGLSDAPTGTPGATPTTPTGTVPPFSAGSSYYGNLLGGQNWYYAGAGSIFAPTVPLRPLVLAGGATVTAGGGGTVTPTTSYDPTNNSGSPAFGVSLRGRY